MSHSAEVLDAAEVIRWLLFVLSQEWFAHTQAFRLLRSDSGVWPLEIHVEGALMALDPQTVDLGEYPDLVVIHFGLWVRQPCGLSRLLGFAPRIQKSCCQQPDGFLLHEDLIWSPHLGMRQYWRDPDSLNRRRRPGIIGSTGWDRSSACI